MTKRTGRAVRACSALGGIGAVLLATKAAAILATGDQPPVLFELGSALFPAGLLGLSLHLDGRGGRVARAGAISLATVVVVVIILAGWAVVMSEVPSWASSVLISLAALATVASLILLGVATRRLRSLGPRWSGLPFWLGVTVIPLVGILGGALEAVDERLLEVPFIAVTLAWALVTWRTWHEVAGEVAS